VEPATVRIPLVEFLVGVTPARPMVRVEAPVELKEQVEDRDANDNGRGDEEKFYRIAPQALVVPQWVSMVLGRPAHKDLVGQSSRMDQPGLPALVVVAVAHRRLGPHRRLSPGDWL
jgi:hypothetical protein